MILLLIFTISLTPNFGLQLIIKKQNLPYFSKKCNCNTIIAMQSNDIKRKRICQLDFTIFQKTKNNYACFFILFKIPTLSTNIL